MTPEELAARIPPIVEAAQRRIHREGTDQYYDPVTQRQRFEDMPLWELVRYAEEEQLDAINYAAMHLIRLERLRTVYQETELDGTMIVRFSPVALEAMTHSRTIGPMDVAAQDMIRWTEDVMPDVGTRELVLKLIEEVNELLGFEIAPPDDWTWRNADLTAAANVVLVLSALCEIRGRDLGVDMLEKMRVNRKRKQERQLDGTYRHAVE